MTKREQENHMNLENAGRIALWRLMSNLVKLKSLIEKSEDAAEEQKFFLNLSNSYQKNIKAIINEIFPGKTLKEIFPKPKEPT